MIPLLLLGCQEEPSAEIAGSLVVEGTALSLAFHTASAAASDGRFATYLAGNNADCETTSTWLASAGSADPSAVFAADACNLYLPLSDYTLGVSIEDDPAIAASMTVVCTLGEGEFVLGEEGYAWSGTRWQGYPTRYAMTVEEADGGYQIALRIDELEGYFPDSGTLVGASAAATLEGTLTAADCPALGTALGW